MKQAFLAFPLLVAASPACAQELRDFCGDRPGIGTPACTVDRGHLQIEAGLGDWTLDRQPDSRTDTILAGAVAVRYGLTDSLEARIGWTGYGHERVRDRMTGGVSRQSGVGDVTLGLKQNLSNPDGSGLSIALLPFATLPVGRQPVGAGDWGAGMLIPVTYELSDTIQLGFTPEVDAEVDEDGDGRHLAYSGVVELNDKLNDALTATLEYQALRDRDPAGHETRQIAGLSLAWEAKRQLQLDIGSNIGLNHAAPDMELYVGISRKF
jgi:hypothetical protein